MAITFGSNGIYFNRDLLAPQRLSALRVDLKCHSLITRYAHRRPYQRICCLFMLVTTRRYTPLKWACDREREHIPPPSDGGHPDTASTNPAKADGHSCCVVVPRNARWCIPSEMPSSNHKRMRTIGSFHGDDTDSDGALLTGPQPYRVKKTIVLPECL